MALDPKADLSTLMSAVQKAGVVFVRKQDSRFHKAIAWVLWLISFGKLNDYHNFATTIGRTIALPENFDLYPEAEKVALVEHELTHVRQYATWGLLFMLSYVLFPLPVGLAYFRWVWEREAYLRQLQVLMRYGNKSILSRVDYIVENLSGPAYIWAWPFRASMRTWFLSRLF